MKPIQYIFIAIVALLKTVIMKLCLFPRTPKTDTNLVIKLH